MQISHFPARSRERGLPNCVPSVFLRVAPRTRERHAGLVPAIALRRPHRLPHLSPSPFDLEHWFEREVQPHAPLLRSWLRSRFPDVEDVDNLVQESLARLIAVRQSTPIASPKTFLFTTARNLALDQLRRRNIFTTEPLTDFDDSFVYRQGESVADAAAHHQELELLTQAIQSLPDRCRQVLTLRKIYGLSQKEIARQLGISENTVEAQVANGVRRVADFLGRLGLP